jgi:hypothetical protein
MVAAPAQGSMIDEDLFLYVIMDPALVEDGSL